jgi:microcystin-dependent protein
MAYVITNSRGQVIATLETGTENTSATSVILLGAGFPAYGLQQNENFVRILENFANSIAPDNPIPGQLWFNTSQNTLYQRTLINTWQAIATQDYVQSQKTSPVFTGAPQAPTYPVGTASNILATTGFVADTLAATNYAPINSPAFTGNPTAPTISSSVGNTQIATTEYVVNRINRTDLSPYAPINSPAFTGVPTAPTAAAGTNTTQLATTAFATSLFNNIDLAPYAPKASPTFTGVPIAPTAPNATSTTQIATTAFVNNLINNTDLSPYAPKASPTFTGTPQAPTPATSSNTNQLATTNFVQLQKVSPAFTGIPTAPTQTFSDNSTSIATTAFVQSAVSAVSVAVSAASELAGSIKMWASATPPNNWALCDGQALSRTVYATLFSRIGTTFGAGDGSTTFNVPNYQGRFPIGANPTYSGGSTGGYTDAAVITHTHAASTSVSVNDNGHSHIEQWGQTGGPGPAASGNNLQTYNLTPLPNNSTAPATTGISVSATTSISAPDGAVSGTGRNLPPYLAGWWIIKLSDDGAGGGTLQAGAGIDIATAGGFSTITNTGVRSLTAGTGISITGSSGVLTITNTGTLPTLTAGQGISIVQAGTTFTITNTVAAIPVIAGTGTTVTNTPGGAIVNANVANLQGGTGITVSNNGGTWTINAPGSGSASLGASGWQEFPSGLIMQWGGPVTVPRNGGFVQVTFPRAFPNNFYNGSITPVGAASQDMGLLNPTTTGMRIYTGSSDGSNRQAYWTALGD